MLNDKQMLIRVKADEKELIERAARAMGISTSAFIRRASLSLVKKVKLEEKEAVNVSK